MFAKTAESRGALARTRHPLFSQRQLHSWLMQILWTVVLAFLVLLSVTPPFFRLLEQIIDER